MSIDHPWTRAERARTSVITYIKAAGDTFDLKTEYIDPCYVSDLITDLLHFNDRMHSDKETKQETEDILRVALMHYEAEKKL